MAKHSRPVFRAAALQAAEDAGRTVRVDRTRGVVNGGRLEYESDGETQAVAVRTSLERILGFSRTPSGAFRTFSNIDFYLVAAPLLDNPKRIEVLEFSAEDLEPEFKNALAEIIAIQKNEPPKEAPIFIPLDEATKKNLGHSRTNLRRLARWTRTIDPADLPKTGEVSFVERVKREFAQLVGVDASKVTVKFGIDA